MLRFARPFAAVLALFLSACSQTGTVDPDAMKLEIGRRAFEFYRHINEGRWEEAGLFMSERLRAASPDPEALPVIRRQKEGKFQRVMAGSPEIDWRRKRAVVPVSTHNVTPPAAPGRPVGMGLAGHERHRWVFESGDWYYDGDA